MSVLSLRNRRGEEQPANASAGGSSGSRLRRWVVIGAAVVVGYAIVRRLRSGDDGPTVEEITETAETGLSEDAQEITIEAPSRDAGQKREADDEGATGEPAEDEGDVTEDRFVEERSSEELAERASEEPGEESPEPGEMTVDEDVVDDLVDDAEAEEGEKEETDEDET